MPLSMHDEPQEHKLRENGHDRLVLRDSVRDALTKAEPEGQASDPWVVWDQERLQGGAGNSPG